MGDTEEIGTKSMLKEELYTKHTKNDHVFSWNFISPKNRLDFAFLCNMKPFLKTRFHVAQTGLKILVE